ncbi:UDP-Gal:alpha-D-GlcNAc-diphosphoundecaprenol beta-1,3-galactosyltransferase [Prochlorococcus sp. MIT 1306]|nr:UDP-Gal:alpha-D-GlcNAc-diphosphoundecaprenol beta-1,3-galactosyltransferase [Prochlorococcus sp. MIT 1306]
MPLAPSEAPELLKATLDCLEKQTLQAQELIIAADGPLPLDLCQVIESCHLPVNLKQQKQPQGIGAMLEIIAPFCKGDVIMRIDSDDLYAADHTELMALSLINRPGIGVLGSQLLELDTTRAYQQSARKTPTSKSDAQRWLPWRNPLNHQTIAIHRHVLIEAGGYRHTPGFEDWDLWIRVAAAGYGIVSLASCTSAARVNDRHRKRRRGLQYILQEVNFYARQVRERKINPWIAIIACLSRLPWRLLPARALRWWMQSKWRGSPTFDTSWVSEFVPEGSRPQSIR